MNKFEAPQGSDGADQGRGPGTPPQQSDPQAQQQVGHPHAGDPHEQHPQARQPYAGHPYAGHPHPGQPNADQSYAGHPYAGHPHPGQPNADQSYAGHPYAGDPNAAQPYSGHPNAGQPYSEHPYAGHPYAGQPYVGEHAQQQWAPPVRRRRRRVPLVLGTIGLVAATVAGSVAWGIDQEAGLGSGSTLAAPVLDPAAAAAKVSPGLVDVNTVLGLQGAQAAGTGMVLTSTGEVLTNHHVVQGATKITVTDVGNGKTYAASVVGYDSAHDVAVLQLKNASGLTTITAGDSSKVAVGDRVVGVGNAGGVGGQPSYAAGTVTALDQAITATDESGANAEQLSGLIEDDANIQAGDSGGPLVNTAGQVIGMDTAGSSSGMTGGGRGDAVQPTTTQGYAVPINQALAIADQIEDGQASATVHVGGSAMLGVSVVDAGALGMAQGTAGGAVIDGVLAGGRAAEAGLAAGDVIIGLGGHTVGSPDALSSLLDQYHPGDKVRVTWIDQAQQEHTTTITLATGPVR